MRVRGSQPGLRTPCYASDRARCACACGGEGTMMQTYALMCPHLHYNAGKQSFFLDQGLYGGGILQGRNDCREQSIVLCHFPKRDFFLKYLGEIAGLSTKQRHGP